MGNIQRQFEENLRQIEKLTGMRREEIARTLCILNLRTGRKWEATLWKHTASKAKLEAWIDEYKERGGYDENAFAELASYLPAWARRSLLEIAQTLPSPHGGKQRSLRFRERLDVMREFQRLTQNHDASKKLSNKKAYEKIAKQKHVSAHTIRNICDAGERERSKNTKTKTVLSKMNSPNRESSKRPDS